MTMFFVYILQSRKTNRYYTGSAQDLTGRVREHNAGESRSTRAGIPWDLVYSKGYQTRAEAVRMEKTIKARGAGRFLNALSR